MTKMDIGIGLPTSVPGVQRSQLLDWARRAEALPFSTLGAVDRLVWDTWSPLVSLGAVAAVTERIKLMTCVTISPLQSAGQLVADVATLDQLAGPGRFTFGVAVGSRRDDYEAAGVDFSKRGRILDAQLDALASWQADQPIRPSGVGPLPVTPGAPQILVGGSSPAALRRTARSDGWMAGGGSAPIFAEQGAVVQESWTAAGRAGQPRMASMGYVSLGGGAEAATAMLSSFYSYSPPLAAFILSAVPATPAEVRAKVAAFEAAGCTELLMMPVTTDPDEVDRIASAIWD